MPLLSIFTPNGALECSSQKPDGQAIYETRIANLGGNFDVTEGTHVEATAYAQSMIEAGARAFLKRGGDQMVARTTFELLPQMEEAYGLAPSPSDTVSERQAALAARRLAPGGATYTNVFEALRALLPDDFIAYRTTPVAEIVAYPTNCGDSPMNLQLPTVPRKLVTITPAIAVAGSQSVAYTVIDQPIDPLGQPVSDIYTGDALVVDPGHLGIEERVTVTAVGSGTFTAVFAKPHSAGVLATTQPYPMWTSNQRHSLIYVSAAAAVDAEKRRKIHELMARITRAVSTWSIIGSLGPYTLDVSPMDSTPFAAVTL